MVLRIIIVLFIIVILAGIAAFLMVYAPLLPLFVQAWLVELFGDTRANTALPIISAMLLTVISAVAYRKIISERGYQPPTFMGLLAILVGLILVFVGSSEFGEAWEIMQQQHHLSRKNDIYDTSFCQAFVSGCLWEGGGYGFETQSQLPKSIKSEILWYIGTILYFLGFAYPRSLQDWVNERVFED